MAKADGSSNFIHTILCVDDEANNVDSLERLFRKKYRVLKATSGYDALKLLKENTVTVIISDQRMPQMSGVEMLAESIALQPDAIRILLTGYTDIESVIAAINSGHIYRYVTKPWDPVDLGNAVDKAVERFELGRELLRKNQELQTALSDLKKLDEAKSQFMILINHELKTPLTAIMSFGDLMNETSLDADQKLYLTRIRSSTQRLQDLVNDVLEFVSAEAGTMKLDSRPTKTENVAQGQSDAIAQLIKNKSLTVISNLEPAFLICDERAIQNVFRRLLHNAAKFALKESSIEINGRLMESGKYHFEIKNTGPNIDEQRIRQLLQPFTLDENIMHHTTGTGLGWSVCQGILKLHSSQLNIESRDGLVRVGFSLATDSNQP
jgi:two-component system, sensor histidine kinase and response regulator